ncbi:sugar transferase [Qipengyuania sp. YIM B01966]|uniref:sugar transferase n=1 Tax=Qipengyuania sp. YIM B01966 TaxID=2778646 RepID=UPI00351C6498
MKRLFDIVVSLVGLILLSPLMMVVAAIVLARFGRPILFRQTRPGLNARPFEMIKFRTMTDERDADGALLPDADRLPPTGQWLRAASLDELPELWNVIKGDMSLVGPRPLLMSYLSLYSARQARRHEVRPGLTGWAQVNGRNSLDWDSRLEADVWYVENRTFMLDLRILMKTVVAVVRRQGISAEGEATMARFEGSGG